MWKYRRLEEGKRVSLGGKLVEGWERDGWLIGKGIEMEVMKIGR